MKVENPCLIIVDMQDKILKQIKEQKLIIWNINRLIQAAKTLNIQVFHTEQSPNKLGLTIDTIRNNLIRDPYPKSHFSSFHCKELIENINKYNINNIVLTGIESHICIQQTAVDFINKGYNVNIVFDAVSSRNKLDMDIALRYLENKGAMITTTESLMFQWCLRADRKEFKKISSLAKEINYL